MSILLFKSIKKADCLVNGKSPSNKIADFESRGILCVSAFSLVPMQLLVT
jgi:hypothetical protein